MWRQQRDPGRRYGLRVTITEARPVQRSGVAASLVALFTLLIGFAIAIVLLWQVFTYPKLDLLSTARSERLIGSQLLLISTGDVDDGLAIYASRPDEQPDCEVETIGAVPMARPQQVEESPNGWYQVLRSAEPEKLTGYTAICKYDGGLYAVGPRDWPSVPADAWLGAALAVGIVSVGIAAATLTISRRRRV